MRLQKSLISVGNLVSFPERVTKVLLGILQGVHKVFE